MSDETVAVTKLERVLMWLFEVENIEKLRELPGLNPNKVGYLLDKLDQDSYREFALTPIPLRKEIKSRGYRVILCLKALHSFWWGFLIDLEKLSSHQVELPHPNTLEVCPAMFVDLYLPEDLRKQNYGKITICNPQTPAVKYDGRPSNFQRFYESLKATAANTSANLLRCIESKTFAASTKELNNVLYNWVVGNVDQNTVERHFYPHKGDGYAALESLKEDPAVAAQKVALVNLSKREIESLKCHGEDVATYISKFEVLAKRGEISDDKTKVDLFVKGFDDGSPYWEKLNRLRENNPSLENIIQGLTNYYASIVSTTVPVGNGGNGAKGKRGKRKSKEDVSNDPKKPKGEKAIVPRLIAEDYKKLTPQERTELQSTGKLSAYTLVKSTEHEGKFQLVKKATSGTNGKTPGKARRVKKGAEIDKDISDESQQVLAILDRLQGE